MTERRDESRRGRHECPRHGLRERSNLTNPRRRARPTRRGAKAHKDQIVLEAVPARTTHAVAPDFLKPSRRWPDIEELLREFEKTRGRTIEFAGTTQADLRAYFRPHPLLKELDAYQWLLLIGSHAERHVRQAEEGLVR